MLNSNSKKMILTFKLLNQFHYCNEITFNKCKWQTGSTSYNKKGKHFNLENPRSDLIRAPNH